MGNTFGTLFRMTTFGESHGAGIGCVVDGCPAGVPFDIEEMRLDLSRRRPGQKYSSERAEADEPEIMSGIFQGVTLGSPIAILIRNNDQRSGDYSALQKLYRPSHADYTYSAKYGVRDHRGGGRASARETAMRVAAGAIARMYLRSQLDLNVRVAVTAMGTISSRPVSEMSRQGIYDSPVRCDDEVAGKEMMTYLDALRAGGDSTGGAISCQVDGLPAGIGEPIYDKLNARLASAMLSINGATGIEFGAGFSVVRRCGSENNDQFAKGEESLTETNNSGGIQGGISNGMPITFAVAFKPPSSIALAQSHGRAEGGTVDHAITGRHDPSIVIRAVPVVEAMCLLVLADMSLLSKASASVALRENYLA